MWFFALWLLAANSSSKSDKEKQAEQESEVLRRQILASMPPIPVDKEELALYEAARQRAEAERFRMLKIMMIATLASIPVMFVIEYFF